MRRAISCKWRVTEALCLRWFLMHVPPRCVYLTGRAGEHLPWRHAMALYNVTRVTATNGFTEFHNSLAHAAKQRSRTRLSTWRHGRCLTAPRCRPNTRNLAIANRSRVSCAHNTSRASIVTPWLWNVSYLGVTEGRWKRHHSIDHTRLTISRVIWRWILSWPWNLG